MKRILIFFVLMIAAVLLPTPFFERSDVSELKPAQLLWIGEVEGRIFVATEEGDTGEGTGLSSAFDDLKATTSGRIFLDTVEYVLISRQAIELLPKLSGILRPGCGICLNAGETDLESAAEYLDSHKPQLTLAEYCAEPQDLPMLISEGGKFHLVQP